VLCLLPFASASNDLRVSNLPQGLGRAAAPSPPSQTRRGAAHTHSARFRVAVHVYQYLACKHDSPQRCDTHARTRAHARAQNTPIYKLTRTGGITADSPQRAPAAGSGRDTGSGAPNLSAAAPREALTFPASPPRAPRRAAVRAAVPRTAAIALRASRTLPLRPRSTARIDRAPRPGSGARAGD
jgi:hypothetical protein